MLDTADVDKGDVPRGTLAAELLISHGRVAFAERLGTYHARRDHTIEMAMEENHHTLRKAGSWFKMKC